MAVRLKRAYETPSRGDGTRVLVERLWPRGVNKADAKIHLWMKPIAPSTALRKWYGHDPAKWDEFRRRYRAELDEKPELLDELRERIRAGTVTLVFATRDAAHSSAAVLKSVLEEGAAD